MGVVVRPFAALAGVRLVRVSEQSEIPRTPDRHIHPGTVGSAFDPVLKVVWYTDPAEEVGWNDSRHPPLVAGVTLLHETIHCLWPWEEVSGDAEDEWDSGMIAYELAWVRRLLPCTPAGNHLLQVFKFYAMEGKPGNSQVAKAREQVRRLGLPDPWVRSKLGIDT